MLLAPQAGCTAELDGRNAKAVQRVPTLELLGIEQALEQPSAVFRGEVVLSGILRQAEQVGLQPVDLLVHRLLLYILSPPPLLNSIEVVRTSTRAESLLTTVETSLSTFARRRTLCRCCCWPCCGLQRECVRSTTEATCTRGYEDWTAHAWLQVAQRWMEAMRRACCMVARSC